MSDQSKGVGHRLLESEREFHSLMPVRDLYSKLFFRTIFWFVLFGIVYTVVSM